MVHEAWRCGVVVTARPFMGGVQADAIPTRWIGGVRGTNPATGAGMARAMWKASLVFGRESLPVKLYSAVEDRGVHFRLLHKKDHVPVKQRIVDPRTGDEVGTDEIVRGIEIERGLFVLLSREELDGLKPQPSRDIEVKRFVPRAAIDASWYYRPYFLGPDGGSKDYFSLAEVLEKDDLAGVARWVMRGKRYLGALLAHDSHLALVALHSANEVVSAESLARPGGPALRKEERALAEQLVSTLDAPFDPTELRDEYRERVMALVEAKAKGKKLRITEHRPPRQVHDLTAALKKSLRAAKEAHVAA
jgi:DNA end-binding protein Ku